MLLNVVVDVVDNVLLKVVVSVVVNVDVCVEKSYTNRVAAILKPPPKGILNRMSVTFFSVNTRALVTSWYDGFDPEAKA